MASQTDTSIPPPARGAAGRSRRSSRSVTIQRDWLLDPTLTLTARAVLAAACAIAGEDYNRLQVDDLVIGCAGNVEATMTALGELETSGYLAVADGAVHFWAEDTPAPAIATGATTWTGSVVYYLRRMDAAVKIGFSAHLARRIKKLTDEHGELVVLATEPGGWHEEQDRHRLFGHLRVTPTREWFWPGAELLAHIESLGVPR